MMTAHSKSKELKQRRGLTQIRLSEVPIVLSAVACCIFLFQVSRNASVSTTDYDLLLPNDNKFASSSTTTATISSRRAEDSQALESISCERFLGTERPDFPDPNQGQLFLRYTQFEPRFWISLHRQKYDPVRWSTMHYGKYYEHLQSLAFVDIIESSKSDQPRIIDVGGNIGWFSMLSAATGAKVDMFEPNTANHLRACETICLNNWAQTSCPTLGSLASNKSKLPGNEVRIYPIGIGAKDEYVTFVADEHNPGSSKLVSKDDTAISLTSSHQKEEIRLMTLDSLKETLGWEGTIVDILKVDVEGFEINVFRGAKELLASQAVQNIFMEGNVETSSEIASFKEIATILFDDGYEVHKMGGSMGPRNLYEGPDGPNKVAGLAHLCMGGSGRRRKQCNLWWKLSGKS